MKRSNDMEEGRKEGCQGRKNIKELRRIPRKEGRTDMKRSKGMEEGRKEGCQGRKTIKEGKRIPRKEGRTERRKDGYEEKQ